MPYKIHFSALRDKEHCIIILLLSAILFLPMRTALSNLLSIYLGDVSLGVSAIFLSVIWGYFFFRVLFFIKLGKDSIFFGTFILLSFFPFGMNHPEEERYLIVSLSSSILKAFPYYVIARNIKDYCLLHRYLLFSSIVINISVLAAMKIELSRSAMDHYSMFLAYAVLPGAILAIRLFRTHCSFVSLMNAIVSALTLIFLGTRGPIFCWALFCTYETFANTRKRLLLLTGAVCIALSLYMFSSIILDEKNAIEEYGGSVRLFWYIENGSLLAQSGRDILRQAAWDIAWDNHLIGVGFLEDRLQIFQRGEISPVRIRFVNEQQILVNQHYMGFYSHFLPLDWLAEYGLIIGAMICLIVGMMMYKMFLLPSSFEKSCFEIFFFAGVIPLFFSGIWHESKLFYITLGLSGSVLLGRGKNIGTRKTEKHL